MRAVALTPALLADVFARRRAIDAREYAALAPSGSEAGHAEALASVSRYGAVILDGNGTPSAAIAVAPAHTPRGWFLMLCATDAWPDVWRATYRWVRAVLEPALAADPDVQRVSALVSADNPPAQRFMEAFGFKAEGVHECVGADGSDWITYARVKRA